MFDQPKITKKDNYRPDIDGLRAIAVSAVVVFHAFPKLLPGGFLGVDVFFVISGYLITGIILRDIGETRFALLAFYQRRIRRIYPALILMLIASLIAGLALLMPTESQQLGWHTLGSALFIPNLLLWGESGYFDTNSLSKPLLHLWSLGVEEQFYLAWPVVLWMAARTKIPLRIVLAAITALSLAHNIYLSTHDPIAAFYSPLSRTWELAAGAILAAGPPIALSARIRTVALGLGLTLVVAALVLAQEATIEPLHNGMVVFGAALMISCGENSPLSRLSTSTKPFVAIGLISYPLYLWHWPILVFARKIDGQPSALVTCLFVALATALAAVTYLGIERPLHRVPATKVASAFLVALIGIGCFGAANSQVDMRSLFYPEKMRDILVYSRYDFRSDARIGTCWLYDESQDYTSNCAPKHVQGLPRIAVWGDSHAGRLYPGLAIAAQGRAQVGDYAADACPPIVGAASTCGLFVSRALKSILDSKPDIVVLYAHWSHYSDTFSADNSFAIGLNATIDALEHAGIRVALVGPFPNYSEKLPDLVFKKWLSSRSGGIPIAIEGMPSSDVASAEAALSTLAKTRHLEYLSLTNLLCRNDACATTWSGDPSDLLSWDYGHLTTDAGKFVGDRLLANLGY